MKSYFITLLFLSIVQIAFAQPKIETTIDSTNLMIGDQVNMHLTVKHTAKSVVLLPKGINLGDNIEVISERDTTVNLSQNEVLTAKSMTITSFDSGVHVIPALPISIETNGIIDTFFTEALQVTVTTPALDSTKSIAPIKDIFTENLSFREDVLPVLLGVFGVLILIAGIYYYTKRQQQKVIEKTVEAAPKLPAHVIAFSKLSTLESKELWQKGDFKTYHSEVSYILREYLENRYEMPALESVTEEIMATLNSLEIEDKQLINLKNILQTADLVKFAKHIPNEIQHRQAMDLGLEFVEITQQKEVEEPEEKAELKVEN